MPLAIVDLIAASSLLGGVLIGAALSPVVERWRNRRAARRGMRVVVPIRR